MSSIIDGSLVVAGMMAAMMLSLFMINRTEARTARQCSGEVSVLLKKAVQSRKMGCVRL